MTKLKEKVENLMEIKDGIVRRAREKDLCTILDLEQKYIPENIAYNKETLRKWFEFQREMFWCYEKNGQVTAFSIITPIDDYIAHRLAVNQWHDMDEFQPEHIFSNEYVEKSILKGERIDYYWSDVVAVDRQVPYDLMLVLMKKLFITGRYIYATPVTVEGERILNRRGFVPVEKNKTGMNYNYVADVTADNIIQRYEKIFKMWNERQLNYSQ